MHKTVLFLLPIKNLTSPSCSQTPISYLIMEFWRFCHKCGPNCIFFIAHARNAYNSTSCQKSDVNIVFADPDFLYDAGILTIRPQIWAKLHIFHYACAKRLYFYLRSKIWRHGRVSRPRFLIWCRNFGDSAIHMGWNCIFFIAHSRNGLISTFCQKSDIAIVFADPDFLFHKGILAILK